MELGREVEAEAPVQNVLCLLKDADGTPLGCPIFLPQTSGPQHLQEIVNQLLNNVCIRFTPQFNSIPFSNTQLAFKFVNKRKKKKNWEFIFCFGFCPGREVTLCILYIRRGACCVSWQLHGKI